MIRKNMHKTYCFAGQTAPCQGYFSDDVLPCVCGAEKSILVALGQVAMPAVPLSEEVAPAMHLLPLSA